MKDFYQALKRHFDIPGRHYLLTLLLFCFQLKAAAQCPAIVISSTNVTAAQCPSSGTVTITASGNGLSYRIVTGPAGFLATSNSTGSFTSLLPGAYLFEVKDVCSNVVTVNATVNDLYPDFSITADNVVNVCTASTTGGTINCTISGGRSPYQYDVVPAGNTPSYSSNTVATSWSKVVSGFGTYRIYAKDACGEVRTRDVLVQRTQAKPDLWWVQLGFDRPCNETMDGLSTASLLLHFVDENNSGIEATNLVGSNIKVYKPNPANSITWIGTNGDCNVSTGTLLSNSTLSAANINPSDTYTYPVTIPREDVIVVITTLCGDVLKICYDYNESQPDTPDAVYSAVQSSCNSSWSTQIVDIERHWNFGLTEPVSYLLTKNGGATITNNHGYFYGLSPSNFPLTIRATDACNRQVTKTLNMPVQGSALQAQAEAEWSYTCTNASNSVSAYLKITGGDLAGIAAATQVTITGGPPSVVPKISAFYHWIPGYVVSNIQAGHTYKVRITNQCNEKDSVQFSAPANLWWQNPLSWNLQASVNQLCGQNKGNITAVANYSGTQPVQYSICNMTAPNTVLQTNGSGLFNNMTAGTYKIKFRVDASSSECPTNFIQDSTTITIISDAVGQSITSKTVLACESNGVTTGSGYAIVQVNGAAPFTYEIIKSSLIGSGSEVWNVSSTNNYSNTYSWSIPLAGDPANTVYTLRSTDKCGNKITTMASLQPLTPPVLTNYVQPCTGAVNYTTGVVPYTGNFTYRWVKLPDTVTTIATTPALTFAGPYLDSYNGVYRCYINYNSGCINRQVDLLLNSIFCGSILPVKLLHFGGHTTGADVVLNWQVTGGQDLANYTIEKSTDGTRFSTLRNVAVKPAANNGNDYTFTDEAALANHTEVYYRLRLNDKNGGARQSNIMKFTAATQQSLNIYPNPVKDICTISFKSQQNGTAQLRLVDKTGRVVTTQALRITKGNNSFTLQPQVPAGMYTAEIVVGGTAICRSMLVKL
jgi:hypothetical protein